MARAALRPRRWHLVFFLGTVLVLLAAAGGAGALALERLFR